MPGTYGQLAQAQPALEALVDDAVLLGRREPAGVNVPTPVLRVEHLEQRRERGAQRQAPPTPAAHVEHPRQLVAYVGFVGVGGVLRVVGEWSSSAADRTVVRPVGALAGAQP